MIDIKELIKYRSLIKKIGSSSGGVVVVPPVVIVPGGGDPAMGGSTGSGGSGGSGGGASFKLTDDGEGNVTLENAALVDNDGALVITLVVNTSELNGHVTVGG
jgi:hypothetical protein